MSREVTFEKVVSDLIFDILTDERPLHRKIILARIQERGINVKGKNKESNIGAYLSLYSGAIQEGGPRNMDLEGVIIAVCRACKERKSVSVDWVCEPCWAEVVKRFDEFFGVKRA